MSIFSTRHTGLLKAVHKWIGHEAFKCAHACSLLGTTVMPTVVTGYAMNLEIRGGVAGSDFGGKTARFGLLRPNSWRSLKQSRGISTEAF